MPIPPATDAATTIDACDAKLIADLAKRANERCHAAAAFSETASGITRTFCSTAMAELHGVLRSWMESAGLRCQIDAAGNLCGRFEPPNAHDAPALVIGSHLDTVPNGGRYDGMLGVLLGLALVEAIGRSATRLPFAIEVIGFSEEEGVRFGTPFIGSKALIGECVPSILNRVDTQGISIAEALRSFGCRSEEIASAERRRSDIVAFVEAHIEQGPVLQNHGLPLAVVSAIAGQTRAEVRFVGTAGHAGTVPMSMRRDALTAAAEWIGHVEGTARQTSGLVATVGTLEVLPNVANVIPGEARLRLDVRHADDAVRTAGVARLFQVGSEIAARRGITFQSQIVHEHGAINMDATTMSLLEGSIAATGVAPLRLVSGAGHDAAVMARRFPTAMLFVRCRDGISHHPDEAVDLPDIRAALTALWHFGQRLSEHERNKKEL